MKYKCGFCVECEGKIFEKEFINDTGVENVCFSAESGGISADFRVVMEISPLRICVAVANKGKTPFTLKKAVFFTAECSELLPKKNSEFIYYTDWDHVWAGVGMTTGENDLWDMKRTHAIYTAGIVRKSDGYGVAATFDTPHRFSSAFDFENGGITAYELINKILLPGKEITLDKLRISDERPFGLALGSLHDDEKPRKSASDIRSFFGYNTWEAYHSNITHSEIIKNLEAIQKKPLLSRNIGYFIIDDGWEVRYGDWEPDLNKFPSGMDAAAEDIMKDGLIPGIWTSPFRASFESKLFEEHPGWFLKHDGKYLTNESSDKYRILDITHPGARRFVYDLYRKLYGWGYRYFKTDFLKEASMFCVPGNHNYIENLERYDNGITMEEAMNSMNALIRSAIGEDSFWMGCGTQLTTDCSLMDASRVGGDISPLWARVPVQTSAVVWRLCLNGKRLLADPDFTVFTSPLTLYPEGICPEYREEKPYVFNKFTGPLFNGNELRAWLSFIIISGGLVNLSDRLYALKPLAEELLSVVYRYAGGGGFIPIDTDKTLPRIFTRCTGSETLLAVFNWDDSSAEIRVVFGKEPFCGKPSVLNGIWDGKKTSVPEDGTLTLKLEPRSCELFSF